MKITSSAIDCFSVEKAWPPGFRFHPSDEELVLYYLKRKICRRRLKPDIISETDVYKWDPEDLPEQSILKTGDRQWFFFSPRDRKYPNGARSNRATRHGYWKATGRDRTITCNSRTVGIKKTLVFYRGRAPSGKRTDWVMHEYTVDEEELKRCQTEQDYYALYKVYKKSGPGPKNGEQYGAPFKEEEWADDEYSVVNNHAVNSVKQLNAIPCVDNFGVDGEMKSPPLDDIEEIVNRVMDDQTLVQLHINGNAYAPQDAAGETQTTMLDPLVRDAIVAEHGMLLNPSGSQHGLQASFDITQLTTSQLHSHEASEVTSAPNISEQELHFTEDFLEVDDLIGPEPALSNAQPVEDLPLDNLDGLSELDLYHDAAMFIQDIGSADQAFAANPFLNEMINQFDYQLPRPSDPDVEDDNQLWMHEQRSDVSTSAEVHPGVNPLPITVCDETSTNIPTQRNQNQAGGPNGGTDNWFISGLWGYLESIPAPPASACESNFADHTSEQTSSINRVRIRASNIAGAASNGPPAQKGKGKSKGFFYYSVVGAACAVLCVVMKDPVMKVLGRYMPL